ncbi:hypothetical protein ACFVT5_09770 [Streptomyces sp. NPDC058001]
MGTITRASPVQDRPDSHPPGTTTTVDAQLVPYLLTSNGVSN